MWLIVEYEPVTLFSFRSGMATSSGAKTLFLPTPFAIRTALLDAAIRTKGLSVGQAALEWIKRLDIAVRPPERVVVTNLFTKVLKPSRKEKEEAESVMGRTIAFREYAHLSGRVALAFRVAEQYAQDLAGLLPQVNYFGRRGSFFQLVETPHEVADLPDGFWPLDGMLLPGQDDTRGLPTAFALGVVQAMDDWGEALGFDKLNIYSEQRIILGKDRVRKTVILPYRLVRSSKGFSLYERIP
ncbi:MAG: hypothetical protein ONB14_12250 [candidate division KSB1 bacterium]|nr:hypothetical protein [candidate division KSB1 bacterium]